MSAVTRSPPGRCVQHFDCGQLDQYRQEYATDWCGERRQFERYVNRDLFPVGSPLRVGYTPRHGGCLVTHIHGRGGTTARCAPVPGFGRFRGVDRAPDCASLDTVLAAHGREDVERSTQGGRENSLPPCVPPCVPPCSLA